MKKVNIILTIAMLALTCYVQAQTHRSKESFNFGWRFHLGDIENSAAENFDDSSWRIVNLPHDFQIEQEWVAPAADEKADNTDAAANIKSRLSSRGFKEMGRGWYRKHFTPADSLKGRRILLDFGGIMYVGDVYLNGELVGATNYGYVGFEIDITDKLRFGEDNVIAVMADTRDPKNSRWYTGGGLFRDVYMITTNKQLYFARHPMYITTRDNRFVNIGVEVATMGRDKKMPIDIKITAPDGKLVYEGKSEIRRSTPTRYIEQPLPEIEITNPQLWDTENPNLYTVELTLYNEKNEAVDVATDHFGIRTIEIIPNVGLKLNGKKVLLQGYANHHSLGALGAAAYPRAIEKRIKLMKEWGLNHIRTSHNPYSREFIELCDRNGILVVDELYDKWTRQHTGGRVAFEQLWQTDVPEWIKRDRNSPSVIAWSLGNELQQDPNMPYNDFGVTMYKLMHELIARFDSTRKVTVAMHPRYRNWETDSLPCALAMVTDFQSYNYRYMYFPGDGQKFPWMTFYQSEASVAAMGQNFFEMNRDKTMGLAYWGAIDYLGESNGWPAKGWTQGVFDISLEPKPKAYYMRSFFRNEPLVHIAIVDKKAESGEWNGVNTNNDGLSDHWNRINGQKLDIITYTNADEVELFVNGKSVGVKKNDVNNAKMRNQIRWNGIEYKDGYSEAVAKKDGKVVARHRIETSTPMTKLSVEADNAQWKADGMDLQHIRIYALDKKGRKAVTAQNDLRFKVEGDATIVAVSNGDNASEELNVTDHRRLWNGSALLILRAGQKGGVVKLTISCDGMKDVVKTFNVSSK
ncbi:MAG: DUF4982 domain-containing protein [Marinilabiliaceae bacterium]|nr:DUF4982 domain-containing protein [Marinilabiliaceae bacterium]